MSVTTGNKAVENIVGLLNSDVLPTFKGRAYFYQRPPGEKGEYIAVNHLPFVRRKEVEEGVVNINIHVPALTTNEPDSKRLAEIASEIIELFTPNGIYLDKVYYHFYADSRPVEDEDNTYFVNLQLKVTYNNLNY